MPDHSGSVRHVVWSEVFPWLCLFRCVGLALQARKLVLCMAAMLLVSSGWWLIAQAFSSSDASRQWEAAQTIWPWDGGQASQSGLIPTAGYQAPLGSVSPLIHGWHLVCLPFRRLFGPSVGPADTILLLLSGLWSLAVWGLFGGMLTRIAAVELGRDERAGFTAAMRHARSCWKQTLFGPLLVLAGVVLLLLPLWLVGLLMRTSFGMLLAGIAWPLVLIGGVLLGLLLAGLLLAWPLMWATLATERSDGFDAVSRSYGMLFQRPLQYAFYLLIAGAIGFVAWAVFSGLVWLMMYSTMWSVSWGSGSAVMTEVSQGTTPAVNHTVVPLLPGSTETVAESTGMRRWGVGLINFWMTLLYLVGQAYGLSYFWTSSTAIYLLLRRDLDGTELDDVYPDAEPTPEAYEMPPEPDAETVAGAVEAASAVEPVPTAMSPEEPDAGEIKSTADTPAPEEPHSAVAADTSPPPVSVDLPADVDEFSADADPFAADTDSADSDLPGGDPPDSKPTE